LGLHFGPLIDKTTRDDPLKQMYPYHGHEVARR
jgi:hypothetical protein